MRSISGFYRQSTLANNNPGVIASFGEIDRMSMTFTIEDRNFKFPNYPNTELVTLRVVDELDQTIQTTDAVMERTVAVGEWLYDQHVAGSIVADSLRDQFYASLRTEFADLEWKSMGVLTRSAENGYFMPTHVEFVITDSSYEYHVKIWLSNKSLQEEYEPYILHIIPPVDSLDQFINNTVTVTGILGGATNKKLLQKYNELRQKNPDTRLDIYDLTWHDPEDSASRLDTGWAYIAYGNNGTNTDNIKTAIRDYLAANSTYTDWPAIFPSLFEENDFTIVPLWDRIAVPGSQLDQNLYASYSSLSDLLELGKNSVPTSYGSAANMDLHVANNLEIFATFYRGMNLMVIANPSNQNRTTKLSMLYPDYSSVPVGSDFERMEEVTRTFIETLNVGLEVARTYTENDTVRTGYYRVSRNGKLYIAFLYNDFQYMILTRDSFFKI